MPHGVCPLSQRCRSCLMQFHDGIVLWPHPLSVLQKFCGKLPRVCLGLKRSSTHQYSSHALRMPPHPDRHTTSHLRQNRARLLANIQNITCTKVHGRCNSPGERRSFAAVAAAHDPDTSAPPTALLHNNIFTNATQVPSKPEHWKIRLPARLLDSPRATRPSTYLTSRPTTPSSSFTASPLAANLLQACGS